MNWKKFSEEMPTEEGEYVLWKKKENFSYPCTLSEALEWRKRYKDTHWLLITPPKGDKE
jgi:hypothetical protein